MYQALQNTSSMKWLFLLIMEAIVLRQIRMNMQNLVLIELGKDAYVGPKMLSQRCPRLKETKDCRIARLLLSYECSFLKFARQGACLERELRDEISTKIKAINIAY